MLHQLISDSADRTPEAPALLFKQQTLSYQALQQEVARVAAGLRALGVERDERVAVYLPKQFETVTGLFGTMAAGGVFVPVNPVLKPEQVGHILRDCATRILITSADRARLLGDTLAGCPELTHLIITGEHSELPQELPQLVQRWEDLLGSPVSPTCLLYTSDAADDRT